MNLFKKWSLFKKLVFANILYSIPIIILIFSMVKAQNVNIDFGAFEKEGNTLQRPLQKTLGALLTLRFEDPIKAPTFDEFNSKYLQPLKQTLSQVGDDLEFNEQGLKKRNRSDIEFNSFSSRVKEYFDNQKNYSLKDRLEKLNVLIGNVRTMITHVGDTSGLILDPELNSYYLMDITLIALPQTQDRLSEITQYIKNELQIPLNNENKEKLAVYAYVLKVDDLDRIIADSDTSIKENSKYYGGSASLPTQLPAALKDYTESTTALLQAINKALSTENFENKDELLKLSSQAFFASVNVWENSVNELDKMLDLRVTSLTKVKIYSLIVSILALIVAVMVLFGISSTFNSNMKKVLGMLKNSVEESKRSGELLLDLSKQLSQISTEQAAAIHETSSTMHEIDAMVKSTLDNVSTTFETVENVSNSVKNMQSIMSELNSSMEGINESNAQTSAQMDNSRQELFEIVKIIKDVENKTKVINEIVFQTKLLSFNASVEAARAGEQGKGFSVVAEEVGNLAKMSGSASSEISQMLNSNLSKVNLIIDDTQTKVSKIVDVNNEKVQGGKQLVEKCNYSVSDISQQVKTVVENTSNIHQAAKEQVKGIEEITKAILLLNEIAQKSSQMSNKTETQSNNIVQQAKDLEEITQVIEAGVLGQA